MNKYNTVGLRQNWKHCYCGVLLLCRKVMITKTKKTKMYMYDTVASPSYFFH